MYFDFTIVLYAFLSDRVYFFTFYQIFLCKIALYSYLENQNITISYFFQWIAIDSLKYIRKEEKL